MSPSAPCAPARSRSNRRSSMSKAAAKHAAEQDRLQTGQQSSPSTSPSRHSWCAPTNDVSVRPWARPLAAVKQNFVAQMNAHAKRLGMTGTRFVNRARPARCRPGDHRPRHGASSPQPSFTSSRNIGRIFRKHYLKVGKKKLRNRNRLIGQHGRRRRHEDRLCMCIGLQSHRQRHPQGSPTGIAVVHGHKAPAHRAQRLPNCCSRPALLATASFVGGTGKYRLPSATGLAHRQNMRAHRVQPNGRSILPKHKRAVRLGRHARQVQGSA